MTSSMCAWLDLILLVPADQRSAGSPGRGNQDGSPDD